MSYINFAQLKSKISIEQVLLVYNIPLTIQGEALRGTCPLCGGSSKRAFVATPSENLWHCFVCDEGGDIIALVAKLKNLSPKEAALEIQEKCTGEQTSSRIQPLDHLEYEHEAVQNLDIPISVAKLTGIGYAKKGVLRGKIGVPIRTLDGTLLGYLGIPKDINLVVPKSLREGD